jgi:nucleolar protein 6
MGASKKGQDPTRAERKAKKRKLEDTIPDLPGDGETLDVNGSKNDRLSKKSKRTKGLADEPNVPVEDRALKSGQRSCSRDDGVNSPSAETEITQRVAKQDWRREGVGAHAIKESLGDVDATVIKDSVKKSKKERKAERKAREAAKGAASHDVVKQAPEPKSNSEPGISATAITPSSEEKKPRRNNRNREKRRRAALEGGTEEKAHRFIAFIGVFPFD